MSIRRFEKLGVKLQCLTDEGSLSIKTYLKEDGPILLLIIIYEGSNILGSFSCSV